MIKTEADFSKYDVIIAPSLYMVKPGVANRLEEFAANGGSFVTNFYSGIVDENDLVKLGGYPGELRKLLGIWVEETDALWPDMGNSIVIKTPFGSISSGEYGCRLICDIVHLEGARELAVFGEDFYAGYPAVTENSFGKGKAYYIATDPDASYLEGFLKHICATAGIIAEDMPEGIEVTRRCKDGKTYTFVLNHNDTRSTVNVGNKDRKELLTEREVKGETVIESKGVMILEE